MKTLEEHQFSTRLSPDDYNEKTQTCKSRVFINNTRTDCIIDGAILECCIKYDGHYLAFMTEDIPYEDSLHISLLDKELTILDQASLSWIYTTGTFKLIALDEPDTVTFRFFDELAWRIKCLPGKQFYIPFFTEPRGTHRKQHFHRYFKISALKTA
ncbi:hypothetical protein MNBD_GAMMA09-1484 [hydrothermal vent metagenome]|uniref:Uncharacterized protein n=1 Tax=hydrothermal vent metagenome TaxID=652676 RepID=A0A3B0XWN5_9ZZZZ